MMRWMHKLCLVGVIGFLLAGCTAGQPTQFKNEPLHHSHERQDAMLEDIELMNGKYHVGLTAHLSNEPGKNELDIFFETMGDDPQPVAIPLSAKVTARVTRAGDDQAYSLEFKPVDKQERSSDPDGKCSRFSAGAPWMKAEDKLDLVLTVIIDGLAKKCTFIGFVPKDKSHQDK